jgi:hypothetical protein
MIRYLTQKGNQAGPPIFADTLEEAEKKLAWMIDEMLLPPGLKIIGEWVAEYDFNLGLDFSGKVCKN